MDYPDHLLRSINRFIPGIPIYLLAAVIAWSLKAHYSQADSEQLNWILMPTAWLVQGLTGITFVHEAQSGYVNLQKGLIIAPACAGVNFLIIAFCLTAFSYTHLFKRLRAGLLWVLVALPAAYVLTLGVNALRISVAIFLYDADIYGGWITPRQVHRLAGILVYLGAIFIWHALLSRLFNRNRLREPGNLWHLAGHNAIPIFWYSLIALAVPLVNLAFQHNYSRFVEHVGIVSAACLGLWIGTTLLQLCYQRIQAKIKESPNTFQSIGIDRAEATGKP